MGTKKDIGSAIKERMADYKPNPDPQLWQNVKLNLELKNKKRVLHKWMYLSGVLLLIIGISIALFTTNYMKTTNSNPLALPITENTDSKQTNSSENINEFDETTTTNIKATELNANSKSTDKPKTILTTASKKPSSASSETLNNLTTEKNKTLFGNAGNTVQNVNEKSAKNSFKTKDAQNSQLLSRTEGINHTTETAPVYSSIKNKSVDSSYEENLINNKEKTASGNETYVVKNKDRADFAIAKNKRDSINLSRKEGLESKASDSLKQLKEQDMELEKKLMLEKKDSIKKSQRFYSLTVFSGVSTGELLNRDSRIDPQFSGNSFEQKIMLNYGATLNFNNSSRFSIRTGFFYQQYQTTVNNVEPFTSLRYVDLNLNATEINSLFNNGTNFNLEQEYSYFLIPLEIRYELLKNSSLLGLIGSVNYSILSDNRINLINGNTTSTEIGSSSLVTNELSLGAGLNLRPQLSNRLFVNIEGLLYYQPFRFNNLSFSSDLEIQFKVGLEYKLKF